MIIKLFGTLDTLGALGALDTLGNVAKGAKGAKNARVPGKKTWRSCLISGKKSTRPDGMVQNNVRKPSFS